MTQSNSGANDIILTVVDLHLSKCKTQHNMTEKLDAALLDQAV
ncbi:DUF5066 family protein, partial [Salmonella enterica]